MRSYLFFNVRKFQTKISDSVCNGLKNRKNCPYTRVLTITNRERTGFQCKKPFILKLKSWCLKVTSIPIQLNANIFSNQFSSHCILSVATFSVIVLFCSQFLTTVMPKQ